MTNPSTSSYDTIIVGAGLAGLTAAAQLATAGKQVLLLERNPELGGRARTDDLDGWLFNQGGHALYRSGEGNKALAKLGIETSGVTPPLKGGQILLDGQLTTLPTGATTLIQTKGLSAAGKLQFAKLLATLGRLDPHDYAAVTVDEWLAPYRPEVQAILKALVRLTTYSAATNIMSADAAISQLAIGQDGVLYLHNGWAAMCKQIADTATAAGATITSGNAVKSIERTTAGFRIDTDTEQHHAPTVIVAAGGAELTARLLGIDVTTFSAAGPAPCAASLDLALDAMPSRHHFILGVDEPTYFSVHSPPATMAPTGKVAAVAMRYINHDDEGSAEEHRASLDRLADLAGVNDPVRTRFLRRMTVANGMPMASTGGMAGRPGVSVPGVPGAYIAGDWVGSQGLLADTAIASGVEAASQAIKSIPAHAAQEVSSR